MYLGVLVWGLFIARKLLRRLADGLVFEPETGVLLRRFGMSLVDYAALTPLVAIGHGVADHDAECTRRSGSFASDSRITKSCSPSSA